MKEEAQGNTWWVSINHWIAASRNRASEYGITLSSGAFAVRWGSSDCCFARSAASATSFRAQTAFGSFDSKLFSVHHLLYTAYIDVNFIMRSERRLTSCADSIWRRKVVTSLTNNFVSFFFLSREPLLGTSRYKIGKLTRTCTVNTVGACHPPSYSREKGIDITGAILGRLLMFFQFVITWARRQRCGVDVVLFLRQITTWVSPEIDYEREFQGGLGLFQLFWDILILISVLFQFLRNLRWDTRVLQQFSPID